MHDRLIDFSKQVQGLSHCTRLVVSGAFYEGVKDFAHRHNIIQDMQSNSTVRENVVRIRMAERNGNFHPHDCTVMLTNVPLRVFPSTQWKIMDVGPGIYNGDNQRAFNSFKASAPFLFPNASEIILGDTKCEFTSFIRAVEKSLMKNNSSSLILMKHPDFEHRSVRKEFEKTLEHVKYRNEPPSVIEDIHRLRERYESLDDVDSPFRKVQTKYGLRERTRLMPDTACIYMKNDRWTRAFSRIWNCEIVQYSMRSQLCINFALDHTPGLLYSMV